MDVIFYFVVSLLVATLFCWLIFSIKNNMQGSKIQIEQKALLTVGTDQQKEHEREVVNYKGKINDFSNLLKNHEFASNVLAFMGTQTMPNIWFKQFALDEKNDEIQLSGEADNMDAFSRQVATFEGNKYVKSIGTLNSSLGGVARTEFAINLVLDQNIFGYISGESSIIQTTTPSEQSATQQGQNASTGANTSSANPVNVKTVPVVQQVSQPQTTKSSEKLITSFHLLLHPEVIGVLDETNYTVTLNVPFGTDIKNITPAIVISPEATVSPASGLSQNFTNAVTYMVRAQDGSVQRYIVKLIVAAQPQITKKSNQSEYIIAVTILSVIVVIIILAVILFVFKKAKSKNKV